MLTSLQLSEFQKVLSKTKKIAIATHYNPDGDAVGSSLALYSYFISRGYEVNCVVPNNVPDFYHWLPGFEKVVNAQQNMVLARKIINEANLLFLVDMNAEHRSGVDLEDTLMHTNAYKVLIDHHLNPSVNNALVYSDTQTTSTCENVYRFLTWLTPEPFLNKEIGTCIYTGIMTDTGSFSYSCNNPETYLLIAKLLEVGVNAEDIHRDIYDNYAESRFRLLGLALNKLKVFPELGVSYMYLTRKEMKENGFKDGDTEGFVNYGISLKGIFFTAFFIEREKRIRISFRSKGEFDVNHFAQTYFQGGGHRNASASYHYDTLENTIKYFEEVISNLR